MDTLRASKNLDKDTLSSLVQHARDFAIINGILMIPGDPAATYYVVHVPFTLFPSYFPKKLYQQALDVQKDFNILVDKVSKDSEFIRASLDGVLKVDNFTKKLVEIQDIVSKEGVSQRISLNLIRCDYIMHPCESSGDVNGMSNEVNATNEKEYGIKQVEINTIAAAAAGISSGITNLHRYIEQLYQDNNNNDDDDDLYSAQLPDNNAIGVLSAGILQAWSLYGMKSAIVLLIYPRGEQFRFDQKMIEYKIRECNPAVRVVFKRLEEVQNEGMLTEDKTLFVNGKEVAVAYFRAGYSPEHYHSNQEWDARLNIERSRAIKCPTVATQLVGTKKIQQVLAEPGVLERFLTDPVAIKRIRKTFARHYSLDNGPEGDKNAEMAKANPECYVLKPQREAGDNNIFGEDIRKALEKNDCSRSQYILMEKIFPPVLKNYMVIPNKIEIEEEDVVCELGIYGVLISDGEEIVKNDGAGLMARAKSTLDNEGGIMAMRSVLDSPYLI